MLKLQLDPVIFEADLVETAKGYSEDDPLETAVIISLFTYGRAELDDVPAGVERYGYWADSFNTETPGHRIGSRLWTLRFVKQEQEALVKAKLYTEEALRWMLEGNVAQSISVETAVVRRGILGIGIRIKRPDDVAPRFLGPWKFTYAV